MHTPNWFLIVLKKFGKTSLASDFCFKRKAHVTLVQTINETNHSTPKILGILDGPQISEWIKENGEDDLVLLRGKETWWCLENSQISQCKLLTSTLLNCKGNISLSKLNGECLKTGVLKPNVIFIQGKIIR